MRVARPSQLGVGFRWVFIGLSTATLSPQDHGVRNTNERQGRDEHDTCKLNTSRACLSLTKDLFAKNLFSLLSTVSEQTSNSIAVMAKFEMQKLVVPVEGEGGIGEKQQVMCIMCGTVFQTALRTSVQRHFEEQHKYTFATERGKSRLSEPSSDLDPVEAKVKKANMLRFNISDRDDYIKTCVKQHVRHNLPFAFWDGPETRALHKMFEKHFDVSMRDRKFHAHISSVSDELSDKIRTMLFGSPFSIKFDIASRQRRSSPERELVK